MNSSFKSDVGRGQAEPVFDIIPISQDAVAAIMPVMDCAFDPHYSEAWTLEQCQSTLLLPGTHLIAAIKNDHVVGFAFWMSVVENSELLLLAVDPALKGQGIGRYLMDHWIQHCSHHKAKHLFLEVRENNNALDFYKLFKFDVIGTRTNYYKCSDGKQLSALTMKKAL